MMWPYKDTQAEPAKGRAFPLTFVNVLGLLGKGRRHTLVFRNPTRAEKRQGLVAQFRPGKRLILLSVPIELSTTGIELWPLIVRYCGWLARRSTSRRSGQGPVYDFDGGLAGTPLSIVERWYHFQTRKYRSTDKFTGGLNRKLLKVDEYQLQLPDQSEL
jgi:hypothetical protein